MAVADPVSGPEADCERHWTQARVRDVLAEFAKQVPECHFRVLYLRWIEGLTIAQIAAAIGTQLRAMGLKHKISLGTWFRPAFRGLLAMRRLRGTPLDPFGRAHVRRVERSVRRMGVEGKRDHLIVKLHPEVAMYVLEHEKDLLKKLEKLAGFGLELRDDPLLRPDEFKLVVKAAGRDVTQQYAVA